MRTLHLFLCLVFAVLVGACDGPSSFERTNPKDPKSDAFVPRPATKLIATPKQNGTVLLHWPGGSTFADGHLIEKSLGDKHSFERLATVSGSDSTYRDTTRQFARPTHYRVRPFVRKNGKREFSESRKTSLAFAGIESLQIGSDPDGTLHLSWADSSRLERAFRVKVSINGSAFQEVATLPRNQETYSYQPSALSFADTTRTYRVTAPLLGADTAITGAATRRLNVRERFAPNNVSATILDEETVRVTWNPRASFADHLRLVHDPKYGATTSVTLDSKTEKYTFEEPLAFWGHRYSVSAVDEEGHQSTANATRKQFEIDAPTLTISSEGDPPDAVNLSWTHPSPDLVAGFELIRSAARSSEQKTITLAAETRTYVDSEVDEDTAYHYWIQTKTSPESETHMVVYSPNYQRIYTVDEACGTSHWTPGDVAIHPSGSPIAAPTGDRIALIDSEAGTVTECISGPIETIESDYTGYPNVSFSPGGTLLGAGIDGASEEVFLWNLETDSTTQQLNLAPNTDIQSIAFGPSGELVGAAGNQGWLGVWHTNSGDLAWSVSKQLDGVTITSWAISFDASGETVATGGGTKERVVLRNARSGSIQKTFDLFDTVEDLQFAQTAQREVLVVSKHDHETLLFDPSDGEQLVSVPGIGATVSLDATRMGVDMGVPLLWSLPEATPLGLVEESSDGSRLALPAQGKEVITGSRKGIVRWKPVSGSERWKVVP